MNRLSVMRFIHSADFSNHRQLLQAIRYINQFTDLHDRRHLTNYLTQHLEN